MKKYNSFLACHVKWCGTKHFTLNLTHIHESYMHNSLTEYGLHLFMSRCQFFSFELFSKIYLSCFDRLFRCHTSMIRY